MKNSANFLFIFSTLFVVLCLFEENIWSAEKKKKEDGTRGKYLVHWGGGKKNRIERKCFIQERKNGEGEYSEK